MTPAVPRQSLLLAKPSGLAPHGGGQRFAPDSPQFATLHAWIAAAALRGDPGSTRIESIELSPRSRLLDSGSSQRLRVVARYGDGRTIDVTSLSRFQSNNDALATVDETGLVTAGQTPGQVAVMASFMGRVDVFEALIPRPEPVAFPDIAPLNFIDTLVYGKLRQLNIVPAEVCSDAEFLRRVQLDLIGTLPTTDEARAFLADTGAAKRSELVDRLLDAARVCRLLGHEMGRLAARRSRRLGTQRRRRVPRLAARVHGTRQTAGRDGPRPGHRPGTDLRIAAGESVSGRNQAG